MTVPSTSFRLTAMCSIPRPQIPWTMPLQLLKGSAGGRLVDVSERAGSPFGPLHLGRGLAVGDVDNDGRLDAVIVAQNEPLIYLHNRTNNHDHFITILLEGTTSNRDGVGARITAIAGGRRQVAQRFGGGSYQSAHDPRIHFGLGAATSVESVEIRWPSGRVDRQLGLKADRFYRLREGGARLKKRCSSGADACRAHRSTGSTAHQRVEMGPLSSHSG